MVHRHPGYWEDPEAFDPDRFCDERSANRPRYAYFPFGGGQRMCLGNVMAEMMLKLVVATVLRGHRLELVPGHKVVPQPSMTLRPRNGVQVVARPRG